MTISGFTFIRNASRLYYPVEESIRSILELVDEFVIAVGKGDPDDNTLEMIEGINSEKIKIIHTVWEPEKFPRLAEFARQTDIAKEHCTGDWLFYLQGDEVIHEDDHGIIKEACQKHLDNQKVEGFLFKYLHFWGDYEHCFSNHCWYPREIRIIRNNPDIHSYKDAQSFRWMPDFDGINYMEPQNSRALRVIRIPARVFHYGWVRPPSTMQTKKEHFAATREGGHGNYQNLTEFDYGRMDRVPLYKGTHASIMQDKIAQFDWKDSLRYEGPVAVGRKKAKHEQTKYRLIMWIEKYLLGGRLIGGFKNYKIIQP